MGHRLPDDARVREMNRHAYRHARRLGGSYLGTEHQLLGILSEGGLAAQLLAEHGIDEARAFALLVRTRPGAGPPPPLVDDIEALETIGVDVAEIRARVEGSFGPAEVDPGPLMKSNPAATVTLWLAEVQAERLGATEITPEHWLLGLIWHGGAAGLGLLWRLLPSLVEFRRRLLEGMDVPRDVIERYLGECERSERIAADRARAQRDAHNTRWITPSDVDDRTIALFERGGGAALDGKSVLERLFQRAEDEGFSVVDNSGGSEQAWVVVNTRFRQVYVASAFKDRNGLLSGIGHKRLGSGIPAWLNVEKDVPKFPVSLMNS